MTEIIKVKPEGEILEELIRLSAEWEREGITFGLRANTAEDMREPCFIAKVGGSIAGYAFGHFYAKETRNSFIEIGARCFELDELYVRPEYRSQGIGRELFRAIEGAAKGADFMTLSTATKDWQRILKFYADDLGMTFHSAYMIKPLEGE